MLIIGEKKGEAMKIIEVDPLPKVCLECADRAVCTARNEGEWCCEECEHLQERFTIVPSEYKEKERVLYDN